MLVEVDTFVATVSFASILLQYDAATDVGGTFVIKIFGIWQCTINYLLFFSTRSFGLHSTFEQVLEVSDKEVFEET